MSDNTNVVTSAFAPAQIAQANKTFGAIISSQAQETAGWQTIVKLYHDGKTADKVKKAELAALYKKQYDAKYPDTDSAKVMFSRGCQRAEVQLGYRSMPSNSGTRKASTSTTSASNSSTNNVSEQHSLEVGLMAKDLTDRIAHFQAHHRLTRDAIEAIGKIADLANELSAKLGNVEMLAA